MSGKYTGKYTGVTFAMQKVSPSDDAIIRRAILPDGKLTGCDISYSGSTLTMSAGHLMVCGRQIRNPAAQNWPVVDATSGFARLVLTIDLTRTATKETFDQVVDSIEYATSKDGFVMLEQADINGAGTRYQVAVCTVSLGAGGITGIVSQLEKCEVGAGLNFKLVGGTAQPADAKENTIWVNTDEEIHGWAFGAENPFLQKTGELYKAGSAKGYFDSAGNVVDSQYLTVTPSISLPDGATSVTVTTGETDLDDVYHVFYNKAGTKVSTVRYASGTTVYPVPNGAVSIRLSIHESNTPGIICEYVTCEDGAVWIMTGSASAAAFNALKKNVIQICPVGAKQYVSGAWVDLTAQIYQRGAWVDWDVYLIRNGVEMVNFGMHTGINAYAVVVEKARDGNNIIYKLSSEANGYGACGMYYREIDLTGVSTIEIDAAFTASYSETCALAVLSKLPADTGSAAFDAVTVASAGITSAALTTASLDVSTLNGVYPVGMLIKLQFDVTLTVSNLRCV